MEYIKINVKDVIIMGISNVPYGEHCYIVYFNDKEKDMPVRISADYYDTDGGDTYMINTEYDLGLCKSIKKFQRMKLKAIEKAADRSWIKGTT